ncbi:MAG: carbohydrate ABC transporter permease [candidate division NC10 bacterium]|nr:carbohydrate ABC transporter permease [candidate division NC10 bacterium]MBI2455910.1 carbohydrate ABC transporter permease [candidate division NC10 bacterium]
MSSKVFVHAIMVVSCLATIFPLLWMVSTSFKAPDDIFTPVITLLPPQPTLGNYQKAWELTPLGKYMRNSALASLVIMASQTLTSLLAAYGFARHRFPGREVLFALFLGTMIVPIHVVMIPNYILVSRLGWIDTLAALIVPQLSSAFGVFMLRQHLLTLPKELFDAAAIDGAGSWRALWQIVVPVIRPAVSALAILFFLNAWNQYFWPLLVLTKPEVQTIPLGLQRFASIEAGTAWGPLMAVATAASVPALVVYLVAQRHIISSFVTSGLKG